MKRLMMVAVSLIVGALLLFSCGAMGLGFTITGLRHVVAGQPGTFVMASPSAEQFMMVWPSAGKYAVVFLNRAGATLEPAGHSWATCQNCLGITQMVRAYESAGWKVSDPSVLPSNIIQVLTANGAAAILARAASSIPVLMVIPDGIMQTLQPKAGGS